jgi:hypothetical protein
MRLRHRRRAKHISGGRATPGLPNDVPANQMSRPSGMPTCRAIRSVLVAIVATACARTPPRALPPFPSQTGDFVILPTTGLDAPSSVSDTEPLIMRLETEDPEPCSYVASSWLFLPGRITIVPFGTRHGNASCAKPIVTMPARVSNRGRPPGHDLEVLMPLRVVVCQPWSEPLVRYVTMRQFAMPGQDRARRVAQRDSSEAMLASGKAARDDAITCASLTKGSAASTNTPH